MNKGIRSSSYSPIYNTNNDGDLIVEVSNTSTSASTIAPNSVVTNPTSSATSVLVLAANALRKTVIIVNDSTQILHLVLGATVASTTNFSIRLLAGGFTTFTGADYSGEVRGIWASANGFARVTETT